MAASTEQLAQIPERGSDVNLTSDPKYEIARETRANRTVVKVTSETITARNMDHSTVVRKTAKNTGTESPIEACAFLVVLRNTRISVLWNFVGLDIQRETDKVFVLWSLDGPDDQRETDLDGTLCGSSAIEFDVIYGTDHNRDQNMISDVDIAGNNNIDSAELLTLKVNKTKEKEKNDENLVINTKKLITDNTHHTIMDNIFDLDNIHGTTDNLEQEDKARPTVILTQKDKTELLTGKGVMNVLESIARMTYTRKTGDVDLQMEKPRPTAAAATIALEKRYNISVGYKRHERHYDICRNCRNLERWTGQGFNTLIFSFRVFFFRRMSPFRNAKLAKHSKDETKTKITKTKNSYIDPSSSAYYKRSQLRTRSTKKVWTQGSMKTSTTISLMAGTKRQYT